MKSDAKLKFTPTHLYVVLGALSVIGFTMHDAQGEDWPVYGYYYLIHNMIERRPEQALDQFIDKAIFIDDENCNSISH